MHMEDRVSLSVRSGLHRFDGSSWIGSPPVLPGSVHGSKLLGFAKNFILGTTEVDPPVESAGTHVSGIDPWRIGLHLLQLSQSLCLFVSLSLSLSRISPSRSVCAQQGGGRSEEKIRKKKKSGALVYRPSVGVSHQEIMTMMSHDAKVLSINTFSVSSNDNSGCGT
jgi:hypothetical protein